MSRLSDVIGEVLADQIDAFGRLDVNSAVVAALPRLDEEDLEALARDALGRRIKEAVTRRVGKIMRDTFSGQTELPFPNLKRAHAIDTEGRVMVLTEEMREMDFRRAIKIREDQLDADEAYLKELRVAFNSVKPIWVQYPDLTFGEICRIYRQTA